MRSRLPALLLAAAGLCTSAPALAQRPRDPAAAEALFNSGKELQKQGDWAGACAKYRASQDLDPAASTLFRIGRCHEHDGKLAQAWIAVQEGIKLNRVAEQVEARRRELDEYGQKLLTELAPKVPRLRVKMATVPVGATLTYDGQPLPVGALGEPLPLDPGKHKIEARAPGFAPLVKEVTLEAGQKADVDLVLVPGGPPVVVETPKPQPGPVAPPSQPVPEAPASSGGSGQRVAGIVVGSVGLAGAALAAAFGGLTAAKVSSAKPYCDADFKSCDADGQALLDSARGLQTGAIVAGALGGAALVGGIVIFATAPKAKAEPKTAWSLGVTPTGVSLRTTW